MSLNLTLPENVVVEKEQDRISGAKFTLDTGVYLVKIVQAFFSKSAGGATAMNFLFKTSEGKDFSQVIYITNKQGGITYTSKKGPNKGMEFPLPGYLLVDSICKLAVNKPLSEVAAYDEHSKKYVNVKAITVSVRDFTSKQNVNKTYDMFTDLMDAKLHLAIEERKVNKQVDNGNGYENTNEARVINEIVKVFTVNGLTSTELEKGLTEPLFMKEWSDKNSGKLVDQFKPVSNGVSSGIPKQTSASAF